LKLKLVLLIASAALSVVCARALVAGNLNREPTQETFPAPPADRTLIYLADERGALSPLAFETASTPLNVEMAAKGDKRSYVEWNGEHSSTTIKAIEPRFYLFLPDEASAKPPFIVRLAGKRGARRVTAMAQKGYKGFAIDSAEIVKPRYRVLGRDQGMIFMEISAREPLMPGEYAIIGTDLKRTASFRVAASSTQ
jgi:hypothetical protein